MFLHPCPHSIVCFSTLVSKGQYDRLLCPCRGQPSQLRGRTTGANCLVGKYFHRVTFHSYRFQTESIVYLSHELELVEDSIAILLHSPQEKIRRRKDRITDLIRENTNIIETLNMMQTEKRDLQLQLDSKQKSLVGSQAFLYIVV